jgi:hypothetical protein
MSYESVRRWCEKFGPEYAARARRRRPQLGDTWHLDEVFVKIGGRQKYLWRAVDQDGGVRLTSDDHATPCRAELCPVVVKHHQGVASVSYVVSPACDRAAARRSHALASPAHNQVWCLPTSSEILELANQRPPTRGGTTDGTIHRTGYSTTVAIVSQSGKRLKNFPVETNGKALVEAIRLIPGHKHVVLEEGTQSAWLHELLTPHAEEVVVAGVIYSRGQKIDALDAYKLAEKLRTATLDRTIFKGTGPFAMWRELARTHRMLVQDVVRVQARSKSIYRSRGVAPLAGRAIYGTRQRGAWLNRLLRWRPLGGL